VVLLLVLISGIVIAVMMERHTAQAITVQRELQGYTFHHSSKGSQEAIEAWLRYSGAIRNMAEALDSDGHAFDITLDNGQTIRVSLFDAQDGVLAELAGLPTQSRELARVVLEELQSKAGNQAVRFVRREGPLAVSANSSPDEVLYAAINAITEGEGTEQLVAEITHNRQEGALTPQSLNEIYTRVSLSPDARGRIGQVLTAQPTLWRVVAEAEASQAVYPRPPARRFCGLVVVSGAGANNPRDRASQLQRNSMIISWEDCSEQR